MKLISGIIWNRIWSGMKLQIDATVQYAKGNEEDGWWEQVNKGDTKIKSAYNTYLYPGLPPGAIANPGLAAIEAAFNPQKTACLFYLHDKNKQIHCARTYEEHKKYKQVLLTLFYLTTRIFLPMASALARASFTFLPTARATAMRR